MLRERGAAEHPTARPLSLRRRVETMRDQVEPRVAVPLCYPSGASGAASPSMPWSAQLDRSEPMSEKPLYERLGGYDALAAVANDLLPRLQGDARLGRFWEHRGADGVEREKQLLIDFLCSSAGGPLFYTGRDMKTSHAGMRIGESDWSAFLGHLNATLDAFQVPQRERNETVAFIESTKADIVEV
jgi:hemoglobin